MGCYDICMAMPIQMHNTLNASCRKFKTAADRGKLAYINEYIRSTIEGAERTLGVHQMALYLRQQG